MEFQWTIKGVVLEGEAFIVRGENIWMHKWNTTEDGPIQLPHPAYPAQMHSFSLYLIGRPTGAIRFAAAEVSPNVWAFYA